MSAAGPRAQAKFAAAAIQAAFVLAILVSWSVTARFAWISPLALPHPSAVFFELLRLVASGEVVPDLAVTLAEVLVAFAVAASAGIALGYGIARSPVLVKILEPVLSALNAIPAVMFVPLFVLVLGLGMPSKIVMGIVTGFFPVVLSTLAGLTQIEPIYVTAAKSMGASQRLLFQRVLLRAALPVILAGLRMGAVVAVLSILGAEAIGSYAGIGHAIIASADSLAMPRMYALIVVAILIAAMVNLALSFAERRGKWQ